MQLPWPFLFIPEQCSRSNPVSSIYNVLVAGMYEFSGALHSESSKFAAAAVLQGTSRSEKPDCEKC